MRELLWATLLLVSGAATPSDEARTLRLTLSDAKGRPVRDLSADELAVLENGVARRLIRLSRDTRPLTVALILDSSVAVADQFRLDLVPAVTAFVRRLPEGTRYGLWTSGTRPTRRGEWTTQAADVGQALGRVVPDGGNTLLDAIDETLDALALAEGERSALVVVTANGVELSSRDQSLAAERPVRRGSAEVHAVQIYALSVPQDTFSATDDEAQGVRQARYERTLGRLTSQSGGRYEHVLTASAVAGALTRIAEDLASGYALTYAAAPGAKTREIKIMVSRPKIRARYAAAPQAN